MNSEHGFPATRKLLLVALCFVIGMTGFALPSRGANAQEEEPEYTSDFRVEDCRFKSRGENPYFILVPGYQLILEGEEEGELERVEITVLNETETINLPEFGEVETRVVEEVSTIEGELAEVARNFFAICKPTNDVYYFGEEVDIYNEDGTITHEGAWVAGEPDEDGFAEPGIIMPGTFLLGARYYHELADGIALDRAENTDMGLEVTVPAGTFTDCVQVTETNPLDPGNGSEKTYCPGIGLTNDDALELIKYGFVDSDDDDDNDDE